MHVTTRRIKENSQNAANLKIGISKHFWALTGRDDDRICRELYIVVTLITHGAVKRRAHSVHSGNLIPSRDSGRLLTFSDTWHLDFRLHRSHMSLVVKV
jgi:hypothetical protein